MRVAEYSVLSNHLHLLVEATSGAALARGMQSLAIRLAKRLDRFFRRSGRVFADRYHSRALRTPREVRNALVYVLNNSSGGFFEGWSPEWLHAPPDPRAFRDPCPSLPPGNAPARSFLLRRGWKRHGLLGPFEVPGGSERLQRARRPSSSARR